MVTAKETLQVIENLKKYTLIIKNKQLDSVKKEGLTGRKSAVCSGGRLALWLAMLTHCNFTSYLVWSYVPHTETP